jgi:hypothetical protein
VQAGKNLGDRDRMRDIRIAVAALLTLVRFSAELVRRRDARQVVARQITLELAHETSEVVRPPHRRQHSIERGGTIIHGD